MKRTYLASPISASFVITSPGGDPQTLGGDTVYETSHLEYKTGLVYPDGTPIVRVMIKDPIGFDLSPKKPSQSGGK